MSSRDFIKKITCLLYLLLLLKPLPDPPLRVCVDQQRAVSLSIQWWPCSRSGVMCGRSPRTPQGSMCLTVRISHKCFSEYSIFMESWWGVSVIRNICFSFFGLICLWIIKRFVCHWFKGHISYRLACLQQITSMDRLKSQTKTFFYNNEYFICKKHI